MVLKEVILMVFSPEEVTFVSWIVLMLKMKFCSGLFSDLGEIRNDLGEISVMLKRSFVSGFGSRQDHICSRRDHQLDKGIIGLGFPISARHSLVSARLCVRKF